ncbi:MAG: FAD:protein FMN transferase, partial [candidate division KSB1 bacterium]|nr:FAD:protein FMN transferase [candidate division KSB1 bacterium]
ARPCASVTVVANSAMEADALSTAIFVLGPEKGLALAERLPGVAAVIVAEDHGALQWWATPNIRGKLEVL